MKQDIRFKDLESAVRKSLIKVDNLKHATPQAKDEMRTVLLEMMGSLMKFEKNDIEVPEFMRETR